jgi:hypothetical protein
MTQHNLQLCPEPEADLELPHARAIATAKTTSNKVVEQ